MSSTTIESKRVLVDSSFRDKQLYPDAGYYAMDLDTEITDVVSLSVVSAYVPTPEYTINAKNSRLTISVEGSGGVVVQLQSRVYEDNAAGAQALATAITEQIKMSLQAASVVANVSVVYSSALDKYAFTSDTPFGLSFDADASPHRLLGFEPVRYDSKAVTDALGEYHSIDSGRRRGVFRNRYLCMSIWLPQVEILSSHYLSPANKSAMIVPLSNMNDRYSFLRSSDFGKVVASQVWDPPIPCVKRIGLMFTNENGGTYEFNGEDNYIEFELQYINKCIGC